MNILETLGSYVANLTPDALDPATVEYTKLLVLDQIGCMIAAKRLPQSLIAMQASEVLGNQPEASLVPSGPKTTLARAVYVNSYAGNLVDADDTYVNEDWTVVGHLGCVVIPVGLGCAEVARRTGLELLIAVATGYDVAIRVGLAAAPSPHDAAVVKGMGTWEVFGAAAAASRLLGLSPEECAHALAVAGVSAPVPALAAFYDKSGSVAWVKNNAGWVALGGLMSALLARAGMRGNLDLLEGGLFSRMCGSSRWREDRVIVGLGRHFMVDEVSIKPYPACRYINSVLDAVREAASRLAYPSCGIEPSEVENVTVEVKSHLAATALNRIPSDITDIPFSIPYLVATELTGPGSIDRLQHVTREALTSEATRALCQRIRVVILNEEDSAADGHALPETYAKVIVRCKSGRMAVAEQDVPFGTPTRGRRRSFSQIVGKFMALAEQCIGRTRSARIVDCVSHLESLPDMGDACAEMFGP